VSPSQTPKTPKRAKPDERIQVMLDDLTVERLREAAEARGVEIEQLLIQLLVAASDRVDELLGEPREET